MSRTQKQSATDIGSGGGPDPFRPATQRHAFTQRSILCETPPMKRTPNGKRTVVPAERRRLILEMLREHGSLTVASVEEAFDVSPMTARRDLALLAEGGNARRTHGGAVLPELAAHEDSFQSRLGQDVD